MQIVLRAAVVFLLLLLVTRLTGKRQLSEMRAFEFVLLVVLGDLIQQGVTQEDYSLTGVFLAVGTFTLLSVVLSYLSWRLPRARGLLTGTPTLIVRDGRLLEDVLRYERLPSDEVLQAMRAAGIRDVGQVQIGLLEPNGKYSFFTNDSGASGATGGAQAR
jgi:uncharacterized membrane protein YcaP (DUF421 family)